MKHILVLGASGFVGGYLTKRLLADGYRVRCLVRSPDKVREQADAGCEIVQGDILDLASVLRATRGVDAVYVAIHTLAPQRGDSAKRGFMELEMTGLQHIVRGCRESGVRRIIYLTSLGISSASTDAWTAGRWNIQQYLLGTGLDVTVIQPGMIVGIGGQGFNMVLANARKRVAVVIGNGRNKSRCIAIDDLTYYLTGVLQDERAYGQCYAVGSDDVLTADELIDVAANVLGCRHPRKIHVPLSLLRLAAPLLQALAKVPRGAISGVFDGLGADLIGNPAPIRKILDRSLLPYPIAVARAVAGEAQ